MSIEQCFKIQSNLWLLLFLSKSMRPVLTVSMAKEDQLYRKWLSKSHISYWKIVAARNRRIRSALLVVIVIVLRPTSAANPIPLLLSVRREKQKPERRAANVCCRSVCFIIRFRLVASKRLGKVLFSKSLELEWFVRGASTISNAH